MPSGRYPIWFCVFQKLPREASETACFRKSLCFGGDSAYEVVTRGGNLIIYYVELGDVRATPSAVNREFRDEKIFNAFDDNVVIIT